MREEKIRQRGSRMEGEKEKGRVIKERKRWEETGGGVMGGAIPRQLFGRDRDDQGRKEERR